MRADRDAATRIIDASANRAREALRVLEDLARFALDDGPLTARLKGLRHDLTSAVMSLPVPPHAWLGARDTPGDVGTGISTESERTRGSLGDVARAGASRLAEALRSIEECAKVLAPTIDARFEALRYRAYTLGADVVRSFPARSGPQWRLCVLVTDRLCVHHPWAEVAARAAAGGADALQLREKGLSDAELSRRARTLVSIAREGGAAAIINDRADVALAVGADGVHLGAEDLNPREVRSFAGDRLIIGATTRGLAGVLEAIRAGADLAGIGPMFPSATTEKQPVGVAALRECLANAAASRLPHLAIGGITPENAEVLAGAGCEGIAVSAAVCGAEDPEEACRRLRAIMERGAAAGAEGR